MAAVNGYKGQLSVNESLFGDTMLSGKTNAEFSHGNYSGSGGVALEGIRPDDYLKFYGSFTHISDEISETLEVSKRLKMAYVYAIAYITYGVFKAAETGDMSSLEQGWQLIRSECE